MTETMLTKFVLEGEKDSGTTIENAEFKSGLEVRSKYLGGAEFEPVRNVVIRDSTIHGRALVWGMAHLGEGTEFEGVNLFKHSSRLEGHTGRVRAAAPSNITFENVKLIGTGLIPLYVAPGCRGVKLLGSRVSGHARNAGVYLDAESIGNVIKYNVMDIQLDLPWYGKATALLGYPPGSPMIAVDGSSHNVITDNKIHARRGGIYIYRNCGEGECIRHATPSHNLIQDNEFLDTTRWSRWRHPIVWENSRKGKGFIPLTGWPCWCDEGYPFGSSQSNLDHAEHNVISGNWTS